MTIKTWNAEGGTTGTDLTLANSSSSGDALAALVINTALVNGGGAGVQYLTAAALQGALGLRIVPAAGTTYVRWLDASVTSMTLGCRYRFRLNGTSVSTNLMTLHSIRTAADGNCGDLTVSTGRALQARNASSAIIAGQTYVLTVGVDYEVEEYRTVDTATTGRVKYKLYLAGETTPVFDFDSGAVVNLGTVQPAQLRLGCITTSTTGITSVDYDALTMGTTVAVDDEWGPIDSFMAPVNCVVTPTSSTTGDLTWDAVATAIGYDVERDAVVIATDVATNSYSDSGLDPNTLYDYRVRAVK